ncbi:MAG: nucleotide sugar dehydrogenase [Candidatus Acidiferrales bacterium]
MTETPRISVVGLGKLGSPMAAALAAKGMTVVGVDADSAKVEAIQQGRPPVFEPDLAESIRLAGNRLTATSDLAQAVASTDITFIVVATPSEPSGGFSLRYVLPVCEAIGAALARKRSRHVVVITSTVMPGMTGGPIRETLERASGMRVGHDFGLCYGPEFIALGSVIRDFLNPDFLLIGESDPATGERLEALYHAVCENRPAVVRMNFVNAEIAKLSVNTFVTTKITFANMLARICERLPEADVDVVTRALGLDSRIGGKYLKGAVSYGGPCFPRDNLALAALAIEIGAPADLAQATHRFNRAQISWLADRVAEYLGAGETAGVLGLTYKPNTDVVEEAVGLLLAKELLSRGISLVAYDPQGARNSVAALGSAARLVATAEECITKSSVVVVATPWPEFARIPAEQWGRPGAPRTVIDCWRAFGFLGQRPGISYLALGRGDLDAAPLRQSANQNV